MIPPAKPAIGAEEKRAVLKVLNSGMLAMGTVVQDFEQQFAKYIGVKYAVATSSGTAALHTTMLSLGLKTGDEVITTPFTFSATSDAISFVGAKPVFVDIKEDFNIDPALIEDKITKKTRAILPVHLYGLPADMAPILKIAKKYKLFVIEDAAQSHGATINNKKTGSFGTVGCFSFYATKNLTSAEGGMITTNNLQVAERARMFRNHGSREKYLHEFLGYNYAMTNIEAAIGKEQLKKINKLNALRLRHAILYNKTLSNINDIILPQVPVAKKHVFHQYTIRTKKRAGLIEKLKTKNIGFGIYYPIPLHLQPHNRRLGYKNGDFPVAETMSKEVISLPIFPALSIKNIRLITKCVKNYYEELAR